MALPTLTWTQKVFALTQTTSIGFLTEIYNWFNAGNSSHFEVDEVWTTGGDLMFTLQPKNQAGNVPNMRLGFFTTDNSGTNPNSVNCIGTAAQTYCYCFCAPDGSAGYDNDPITGEIYTSVGWTKSCICFNASGAVDICYVIECEEGLCIAICDSNGSATFSSISGALGHTSNENVRRYLSSGNGATALAAGWESAVTSIASPLTAFSSPPTSGGQIGTYIEETGTSGEFCYRATVLDGSDSRTPDLIASIMVSIPVYSGSSESFVCTMRQIYMGPDGRIGDQAVKDSIGMGYCISPNGPTSSTVGGGLWFLNE